MHFKGVMREVVETILVSIIVVLVIYGFLASVEVVYGPSMEPNFYTGERILVDKVSPLIKPYARGEAVVIKPPIDESKHFIKRIIGLPGDIVKVLDCKVYISRDGQRYVLEEDYLASGICTTPGASVSEGRSLKIPDSSYLVMGDNRPFSVDSRAFGVVTQTELIGRVIFRFWPLSRVGFIL